MSGKQNYDILPYFCIFIDAENKDFRQAIKQSLVCSETSEDLVENIQHIWSTTENLNHILPCLSARSGFDLFLQVKNFPPGSEIIMSAINIPSMAQIIRHHRLKIVSLDIAIATTTPKVELLESLITPRTVAILVAQLYGKQFDVDPIVKIAKKHRLSLIEDNAECFRGLKHLSHAKTDLALYSFGPIKFFTSFGGGVSIVQDNCIYRKMSELQRTYPVQSRFTYLQKVLKYFAIYGVLSNNKIAKQGIVFLNKVGVDYQKYAVKMLRGFPNQLIENIRYQPSPALLSVMLYRQSNIGTDELLKQRLKGEYVERLLPPELETVGKVCEINNYWLFPILVNNPDTYVATITALGVDAYRGATQLNLIEGDDVIENRNSDKPSDLIYYPHEAKYLIDHVVYLPVNKHVPYSVLDEIIRRAKTALNFEKCYRTKSIRTRISSKL